MNISPMYKRIKPENIKVVSVEEAPDGCDLHVQIRTKENGVNQNGLENELYLNHEDEVYIVESLNTEGDSHQTDFQFSQN
eukprot:UN08577